MAAWVWVVAPMVVGEVILEVAHGRREVGMGTIASVTGLLIVLGLLPR
jgi:hypothetical protein